MCLQRRRAHSTPVLAFALYSRVPPRCPYLSLRSSSGFPSTASRTRSSTAHVLAQLAKHRLVLIVVVAAFIVVLGALAGVCLARLTHAWACGPGGHGLDDDRGERLLALDRIVCRRRAGGSHHDLVDALEAVVVHDRLEAAVSRSEERR